MCVPSVNATVVPRQAKEWEYFSMGKGRETVSGCGHYQIIPLNLPALASLILSAAKVLRRFLVNLILPPIAGGFQPVEFSRVRLDVEQRGAVQDVDPVKEENIAFAADEFNDAQADAVGTARCPGRKDASGTVLKKRFDDQLHRTSLVKMEDQVDVRKTIQVAQAFCKFRKYLRPSFTPLGIHRLDRGLPGNHMLTANHSNGNEGNGSLCSCSLTFSRCLAFIFCVDTARP
jgi:hypothetical protein